MNTLVCKTFFPLANFKYSLGYIVFMEQIAKYGFRMQMLGRGSIIRQMALINEKIVDIGCNVGTTFGDRATNVDKMSLEEIRLEAKEPGLMIPNFVQADAIHLPFKDMEYDCAVLMEILEHVDDPLAVLNEAQRVAKNIVVCVPNEYDWNPENLPFTNISHKRFYTEADFMALLNQSGLQLVHVIKLWVAGWSHFIAQGISKNMFSVEVSNQPEKSSCGGAL